MIEVGQFLGRFVEDERSLAIARKNLVVKDQAEDAVQKTALLALEYLPTDHENPGAWLTLTLKRTCWAMNRRSHVYSEITSDHSEGVAGIAEEATLGTEREIEGRRALAEIAEGMRHLKPAEKESLSALALGYSYNEIADRTGWTYTKVNRCITEGRAALRESLTSV